MTLTATAAPAKSLLTPGDHTLILIDHQSQMAFATKSIDTVALRTNAALVAQAAAGFGVSTIVTTVAEKSFSGPVFDEVSSAFPDAQVIDRTTMNCWEDQNVIDRVNAIGKPRVVLGGLWTSVCIVGPALYDRAMDRMVQDGVVPLTSLQYLLELQRDWARGETYALTTGIAAKLGGAYGLGIMYAGAMFGAKEGGH